MINELDSALAASRAIAVASELGADTKAARSIFAQMVVLTGDRNTLKTRNGRWCFQNCVRLLARVVGNLQLVLPTEVPELERELATLVPSVWTQGTVRQISATDCEWTTAAAVLNVGPAVDAALPWTAILANGWVARCTSRKDPLPPESGQDNPITCMLAASLGVTEVFKRVYCIPHDKAPLAEDLAFSLFEMSTSFSGVGPDLPAEIRLPPTLLLGAGAIGNGVALLASQLHFTGRFLIVDKQDFAVENLGTCTLLDLPSWLGQPKATMIGGWLQEHSRLDVKSLKSTIQEAIDRDLLEEYRIDLVINGLDDIDARRAVQMLWPSLTVDGAINSVGAAVVTHSRAHSQFGCLRCAYDQPPTDHLATQAAATGLSRASLAGDQNRLIDEEDVAQAAPHAQAWLRKLQRQGRTICSTMREAEAMGLGIRLEKGFSPSVPFVATASASLVVAQLLRNLVWRNEPFIHICQIPSLFSGLDNIVRVKRPASPECECVRHRDLIERIVANRQG